MRTLLIICVFFISATASGQYNFYFGNIHSHSSYSDGNKDSVASGCYYPGQDFYYGKGSYHMDFLGIAEHNHYTSSNNPGMHVADYARGLYQADTSNVEGSFVCMYGMEWGTIGGGGHIVTYGVPALIGWEAGSGGWGSSNNFNIFCAKSDFSSFWNIVNTYPTAFCTLAHPQTGDFDDLAGAGTYSTAADNAIVGTAIRSGSATSTTTTYTDPSPTLYENVYLKTLARGYHLGPAADQDNHYTNFGRNNMIRTVVLASSLKRDSIMAAYRAMRFYASDDWNTQVTFTVNGNYMGSDFTTNTNSTIYVSVTDPDYPGAAGDAVDSIKIYYGSPGSGINATVLNFNTGSNTLSFTHNTIATNSYYYFAKIIQADGNSIWTSPVWVYRSAIALPINLTRFTGRPVSKTVELSWTTAQEMNNDRFEIERSADGTRYENIGMVPSKFHTTSLSTDYTFNDLSPLNGINFYRLKEISMDGTFTYSDVVAVKFESPAISITKINPNPVIHVLNIVCESKESTPVNCNLYNSEGRLVGNSKTYFSAGANTLSMDVSALEAGVYFVVLSRPNERIAEAKFVKQ